jgi:hypothetical protein
MTGDILLIILAHILKNKIHNGQKERVQKDKQ